MSFSDFLAVVGLAVGIISLCASALSVWLVKRLVFLEIVRDLTNVSTRILVYVRTCRQNRGHLVTPKDRLELFLEVHAIVAFAKDFLTP